MAASAGAVRGADRLQEEVTAPGVVLLVGEVGAEQVAQVRSRRARLAQQRHSRLRDRLAALAMVAGPAGGDQVVPLVEATAVLRHDVVDGQVAADAAAVLAGVAVAAEDLAPAQLDARLRPLDVVLESDHRWRRDL